MANAPVNRPAGLAEYLAVARRRKWVLLAVPVAAGVVAYALASLQAGVYRATAQVLVNRSNVVALIANITDPSVYDPNRFLTTEASIARSPELAQRVVTAAGVPGMTPGRLLADSSVTPAPDADLLGVSVSNRHPSAAVSLTNAYASEFTKYKTELDTGRINAALQSLRTRTSILRSNGQQASAAYATLVQYQGQLETVGRLLANNTTVLQPATSATKVSPRPVRDGILAGLIGAVIGIALAFLADTLDRRVRSEHEIEEALGLPLLARVPRPPRRLEKANRLVMLAQPTSMDTEPFRKLRTSVEFINFDQRAKTILITSAISQEGKSTTLANLAVALARSGRNVAVVDLDLRRPFLGHLFHVGSSPGIADVVLKRTKLAAALRPVALTHEVYLQTRTRRVKRAGGALVATAAPSDPASSSNGHAAVQGSLHLLPAGTTVPDPGEFVGGDGVSSVLKELRGKFDYVLIDAPPLVALGDTMTLSAKVDAMFVVARLRFVRRGVVEVLARELETCQAEKLGFVLTGAELEEGYGYMDDRYYYGHTAQKRGRTEQPVP